MLRNTARDLIAARLGNRDDLNDSIVREMDLAMQVDLGQDPTLDVWFTRSEYTTLNTTAGDDKVAVPSDFVSEVEAAALQVYNADSGKWVPLEKADLDTLEARFQGAEEALPEAYAHIGGYFRLFPTPDAVYSLRLIYRQLPDSVLNADVENVWLKYAPDLVIAHVTAKMAREYIRDYDLATSIEAVSVARAKDRLWRLHEAQLAMNRNYNMGDD